VQNDTGLFDCVFWNPPENEVYQWQHIDAVPSSREESVRIYESHVGMAQEGGRVSSFNEYT
jgi:1,4-alpha-glucan branching enzyme